jgi:hypothetical protein
MVARCVRLSVLVWLSMLLRLSVLLGLSAVQKSGDSLLLPSLELDETSSLYISSQNLVLLVLSQYSSVPLSFSDVTTRWRLTLFCLFYLFVTIIDIGIYDKKVINIL